MTDAAERSNIALFRGLNNESSSATMTATKIISGQDNST